VHSDLDFHLAVQHGLLPASVRPDSFARFIARFSRLPDNAVAPRFRFGEMRLSRLNSWAPLLLRRMESWTWRASTRIILQDTSPCCSSSSG
jgi:hypothetical protein